MSATYRARRAQPTYYKVLPADGTAFGGFQWDLPTRLPDGRWIPGAWTVPVRGALEPCANGYHACELADLPGWLDVGPVICVVEFRTAPLRAETKVVGRQARLLLRTAWNADRAAALAADYADYVQPLWDRLYPNDRRPSRAIAAARRKDPGTAAYADAAAAAASAAGANLDPAAAYVAARGAARAAAAAAEAANAAYAHDDAAAAAYAVERAAYCASLAVAAAAGTAALADREPFQAWAVARLAAYLTGPRTAPWEGPPAPPEQTDGAG